MNNSSIPSGIPTGPRVPQPKMKVQPARKQIFVPAPGSVQMARTVAINAQPDQELLHSLYEAILITNMNGGIVDANGRAETLFGLTAAEIRARSLVQLIEKMDANVLAELRTSAENQRYMVIEAACKGPNGDVFQAEIATSGITWRNEPGLCLSIRDITQRKEMEGMLLMINNAMYNTVDGIVMTTPDGIIQFANPAFAEMLALESHAEVVGRNIRSFVTDEALFEEMLSLVLERNRCSQDTALKGRAGTVPVLASGAPTLEQTNELTGMVFSFSDISERLRLEEADRQSRDKELKARELQKRLELLTSLEYGLNNPLQALLGLVELEQRSDYQEHVKRVVEVVREFHETMLASSKPGPGTPVASPAPKRETHARSALVVDDEDVIRSLFVRVLASNFPELKVESASNGAEAVLRFRESRADIVVLDLAMPGMNGEQTYHEISRISRERGWGLPRFLFCTGFLPAEGIRRVVEEDKDSRLLMKPVKMAEFVETVRELMPAAGA